MPNPRMAVAHDENFAAYDTFIADGSTIVFDRTVARGTSAAGRAVGIKSTTDNVIELVADGQAILGRLERVEADGKCVVQIGGYMKLPAGTSPNLARNGKLVGCLLTAARGYVRAPVAATAADVLASRGVVVEITDTTNVGVFL